MADAVDPLGGMWVKVCIDLPDVPDVCVTSVGTILGDDMNTHLDGIFIDHQHVPDRCDAGPDDKFMRLNECYHYGDLRVVVEDTRDEVHLEHTIIIRGFNPYDWIVYPVEVDDDTIIVLKLWNVSPQD